MCKSDPKSIIVNGYFFVFFLNGMDADLAPTRLLASNAVAASCRRRWEQRGTPVQRMRGRALFSNCCKKHVYKSFQVLCAAIAADPKVENAILDGEIVCIGPDGGPIFNQLLYRRGNPYPGFSLSL
jgi:hypothetical protein